MRDAQSEVKLDVLARSLEESNARAASMQLESRMWMESMMAMMRGGLMGAQEARSVTVVAEDPLEKPGDRVEDAGHALSVTEYTEAEWEEERLSLPASGLDEVVAESGCGESQDPEPLLKRAMGKRGSKVAKKGAKVVGKLMELRLRNVDPGAEGRASGHSPESSETFDMDDPRLPGQQLGPAK